MYGRTMVKNIIIEILLPSGCGHDTVIILLIIIVIIICSSSPAGLLQVGRGLLPVQHPGKLLLAAGGGDVPADTAGPHLLLPEEVLLVVHSDRLG